MCSDDLIDRQRNEEQVYGCNSVDRRGLAKSNGAYLAIVGVGLVLFAMTI